MKVKIQLDDYVPKGQIYTINPKSIAMQGLDFDPTYDIIICAHPDFEALALDMKKVYEEKYKDEEL